MPSREHLRRLDQIFTRYPVYFLTACTAHRRPILAAMGPARMLIESWCAASAIHRWIVGHYVVMPDHVHFFAAPKAEAKPLSSFLRDWKKWTTRQLHLIGLGRPMVWQAGSFDHVLRTADSYDQKWRYVRDNPVRAGLVSSADAWPYSGECEPLRF